MAGLAERVRQKEVTLNAVPLTRRPWFVCLLLAAAVAAVYWRVLDCGFIGYDDPGYVTSNEHIQHGLTAQSLAWAFTSGDASNWHPITWLSHMIDVQLFGLKPAGHHLTSLLLHMANTLLLFLLLRRMTGKLWQSAAVAALFALHPLRVESVAWVSERKDVLSTLFWMLTVLAYVASVARVAPGQGLFTKEEISDSPPDANPARPGAPIPHASGSSASRFIYYFLALVFFALGLMSKPMLVTLPFVLLLLDFWPLGRLQAAEIATSQAETAGKQASAAASPAESKFRLAPLTPLLIEKVPFFVLTICSCVITYLVQESGGAVSKEWPLAARLGNATVAYARYLEKTFWPAKLAFYYPHPNHWPAAAIIGALVLLLGITAWAIARARRQPYLIVGWLWFLGMLAPTIGLVQVGTQSMADRYTYLPLVGILIMLVWGLNDCLGARPFGNRLLTMAGALAAVICAILTARQVGYWRDSETLFTHAINVTDDNYLAYYNLGCTRFAQGRRDEAFADFRKTVELDPDFAQGQNNWGKALFQEGRLNDALTHLQKAVELRPNFADAHYNLGNALLAKGNPGEALDEFQHQVDLEPQNAVALENLANNLVKAGLRTDAVPYYQRALLIQPALAEAHFGLGNILQGQGLDVEAVAQYRQALQLQPADLKTCNNLAWTLATSPQPAARNGPEAVRLATLAAKLSSGTNAIVIGTLAAAFAEAGKFSDAVATAQKARELAQGQSNSVLAGALEKQTQLYKGGSPLRDTPGK